MPNWCEGCLKVRGKISNLKSFVLDGIEPVGIMGENAGKLTIHSEDDSYFLIIEIKSDLWMKNTRRHFCEPSCIEVYADSPDAPTVLTMPMRAAWGIDSEQLLELCKKYEVDMKVQGFERGMQFSQIVEIVNGEIIWDETIKYDDWDWDCPFPNLGG